MTADYVWQSQGLNAQQDGVARSGCPYDIGTPAHLAWIQGWIHGESVDRRLAGTFGASPEQWEEAAAWLGPEHGPDPCAEVTANLEEMARDARLERLRALFAGVDAEPAMTAEEVTAAIRHVSRTSAEVMDDWNRAMHALADAAMKTFEQIARELAPLWSAFNGPQRATKAQRRLAQAIDPRTGTLGVVGPSPARPPRYCPRHGDELRGGGCRRCQREQTRQLRR